MGFLFLSNVLDWNNQADPIDLQVYNWFEFRIFFLLGCNTKVKEHSFPYYLIITEGRIVRFMPFLTLFVKLCEMQTVLFKIWVQVAEFISYNDNRYATSASSNNLECSDFWDFVTCDSPSYPNYFDKAFIFNMVFFQLTLFRFFLLITRLKLFLYIIQIKKKFFFKCQSILIMIYSKRKKIFINIQ